MSKPLMAFFRWMLLAPWSGYHQRVVDVLLLGAYLIAMPIIVAGAAYALMWSVLCVVRFIPVIGRKHRHSDWDRLNK